MPSSAEREIRPRPRRVAAAAASPRTSVLFKHPSGQRTKRVKLGFAWDLFLFAGFFGVPLFLRGLPNWGATILGLWLVDLALGRLRLGALHLPAEIALFAAFLGLQIWLGIKGNALTARACRARGWSADNARDPAVRNALERWGIAGEGRE
ncbi:MAG TPA: hypothetical protein VN802_01430 [Stellaceae bacterium]|nr:hypothetical protein [Stellaceae bacterium]